MISVDVHGMAVDQKNQNYVVLLNGKGEQSDKWLPLRMSPVEAQNIAFQMENNQTPRPLSHDLLAEITDRLEADITGVKLAKSGTNAVTATITVSPDSDEKPFTLDASPADAIALALRTATDLQVDETMMETGDFGLPGGKQGYSISKEVKELGEELMQAVDEEEFEVAADLRDQIQDELRIHQESLELSDEIDEELRRAYEGSDSAEVTSDEEQDTGQ